MMRKRMLLVPVLFMLVAALLLGACQPATPIVGEATPIQEKEAALTEEPAPTETPAATEAEIVANEEAAAPTGGTIVICETVDQSTLDIQKLPGTTMLHDLYGASLVAIDPETNEIVPYLAESYKVSEDGLTYEFVLKQNIVFSNGDPLTAQDFVYTIQRAKEPELASMISGTLFAPLVDFEAIDDYELRLTLETPNFTFLQNLAASVTQPVSQRAIEEMGADYDFQPASVGPFLVDEYIVGERIVLIRNPDYDWAPPFLEPGSANIDSVVFRIIPEYATRIAGLEAGEVDFTDINYQDFSRFQNNESFDILLGYISGMWNFVGFNVSKPPFDNLMVRQAFNYAINKDALVTIMLQGNGEPSYSAISKGTFGYNPSQEESGYHYDLEKAKALMEEAGYTYDENGMLLTPEGEPFILDLPVTGDVPGERVKLAEVLSEQYKQLGVEINIIVEEFGIWVQRAFEGNYQITINGLGWPDAEVLNWGLHSNGSFNLSHVDDPVLDELLDKIILETDPASRQEAVNASVLYINENALFAPTYSAKFYHAMNNRIKGYVYSPTVGQLWLNNAYIEK